MAVSRRTLFKLSAAGAALAAQPVSTGLAGAAETPAATGAAPPRTFGKAPVNGIELYHEVQGQGDWLIFLHGGGCTHLDWWRQVRAFRDHYRCVTIDARGLGQSTGEEDAGKSADDVLALMDYLKVDKAFLVGHSAGGRAMSTIAQKHPGRVLGLVMTDTPFGFQTAALKKWAGEMLEGFGKGFDIRDHTVASYYERTDPKEHFLRQQLGRLNAGVRPKDPADYQKRFGEAYKAMRDDPAVDYSRFAVPTLFTVADADGLTTPWLVRETAKAVGGARLAVIPRCGHEPFAEHPEFYNELLAEFLLAAKGAKGGRWTPEPGGLIQYFDGLSGRA